MNQKPRLVCRLLCLLVRLRVCLVACILAMPWSIQAALPPVHQNPKDLAVMIAFAQRYPAVMQSLKSIHLDTMTVHFGSDCIARFGRASASSMPGPAATLEYKSSNCALDNARPQSK